MAKIKCSSNEYTKPVQFLRKGNFSPTVWLILAVGIAIFVCITQRVQSIVGKELITLVSESKTMVFLLYGTWSSSSMFSDFCKAKALEEYFFNSYNYEFDQCLFPINESVCAYTAVLTWREWEHESHGLIFFQTLYKCFKCLNLIKSQLVWDFFCVTWVPVTCCFPSLLCLLFNGQWIISSSFGSRWCTSSCLWA